MGIFQLGNMYIYMNVTSLTLRSNKKIKEIFPQCLFYMSYTIFNEHSKEYDCWFDEHSDIYNAEINALRRFIPINKNGIEIGVGSGRFSIPFNIKIGIEPSREMAKIAKKRGIFVIQALGEQLPFKDKQFDFALLVTTICFVDDVPTLLNETKRILKENGSLIIGFVDKDSPLGQQYQAKKQSSKFYKFAHFYSVSEVINYLQQAGFNSLSFCQTLLGHTDDSNLKFQSSSFAIKDGYGEGGFVVISAKKC